MEKLSNTATPIYYKAFKKKVESGEIPVCETIRLEMKRIDKLIADPNVYYDAEAIKGFVNFCENELTLTNGSDLKMLPTFKLWAEQIFGWYYFIERSVFVPDESGGHMETRKEKKRLTRKQYLIIARGAAKSMYDMCLQAYELTVNTETTQQIATAPTMRQSDETLAPLRTAIVRAKGKLFKFLTDGKSITSSRSKDFERKKLASTNKGIQNFLTNSILEIRPMSIPKLQGLRPNVVTVDEWLSGDIKEDVIGALEQGASKNGDYLIVATSSEGTVRNGVGDTIKMELMDILTGKYDNPHTSIWYYRLDDIKEVADPKMWIKANPNLGKTVSYETYQLDVERAEKVPSARNDILAKRFNIPMEGLTYFFTYGEIQPHKKKDYWELPCAMGADLSRGDDFCAFSFLFPLSDGNFGVKTRGYITDYTLNKLPSAMRQKYQEFIDEGSLEIIDGTVLDMSDVYDDLDKFIANRSYDVSAFGYDPYNAKSFVERWITENGDYGVEKVIQGARTESVPLGELKALAGERKLLFDQSMFSFTMGNCIVSEDTNGNRKLHKKRNEEKIDCVAALMDAWVAYKDFKENFE